MKIAIIVLEKTGPINRFLRKRPPTFSKKFDASKVRLYTLTQYNKNKLLEFSKETGSDIRSGSLGIEDHRKGNPVLSIIILVVFFALMIPLSNTTVRFFNPEEKTLIVNFKYISTPEEYEQVNTGAAHMRALNPVVKKRSPVKLAIFSSSNHELLFEKEFTPRGMRQDIAMFIYAQLSIDADHVDVLLTETAFPDKKLEIKNVALRKGDGTFVILKDDKLQTAGID